jgi:predicted permease
MNPSEIWRLSRKVYREIVFQSYFSLRAGGTLPQGGDAVKGIAALVRSVEVNSMFSKIIMAFFIGFMGVFTFSSGILLEMDRELAAVCGVSSMLSIVLFIMVFMGLQVATSFVSSRVAEFLTPLPVSSRDVSKILLACFVRIFDIPLIAALLIVPLAYGVSYCSIPGSLTVLLGVVITEVFALTIAVFLALSFYSKVVSGGGGSAWRMLMRLFYMLIWVIPMFLMYMVTSFAIQMVSLMKALTQSLSYLLILLYPFSLGFLASLTTFLNIDNPGIVALSVGSFLIYLALAAYSFKWLIREVVGIGFESPAAATRTEVKEVSINPGPPWLGIVKKDLRMASRSPSYFSVLVMPVLQTIILSFSLSSLYSDASRFSTGFLPFPLLLLFSTSLLMVLLLPPVLLNTESTAYSYVGSLPLRKRTLILAKTILSTTVYLTSILVLVLITMVRAPGLVSVLALLGGISTFSVVASIMVETLLLLRTFGQAIPSGNIYLRFHAYIIPLIFGFIVAAIPILVYFIMLLLSASSILSIISLTVVSILEFLMAILLLVRKSLACF